MSKLKIRLITIISLALLFVFTLSLAIGTLPFSRKANAATYTPTSIFAAGNDGEVGASTAGTDGKSWVEFTFREGGLVHYRRDLALKWFEAYNGDGSAETVGTVNPGIATYFTMSFAFPELGFKTFELTFESAEENITKDGIAKNALVFEPAEGGFTVAVKNSEFDEDEDKLTDADKKTVAYTAGQDVTIAFGEAEHAGDFTVSLAVDKTEPVKLENFTNIGGYFLEYRSSAATTPQTPMTFKMTLPEAKEGEEAPTQKLLMKSLNGQTFEVQ